MGDAPASAFQALMHALPALSIGSGPPLLFRFSHRVTQRLLVLVRRCFLVPHSGAQAPVTPAGSIPQAARRWHSSC